jgi:hypothetical protein
MFEHDFRSEPPKRDLVHFFCSNLASKSQSCISINNNKDVNAACFFWSKSCSLNFVYSSWAEMKSGANEQNSKQRLWEGRRADYNFCYFVLRMWSHNWDFLLAKCFKFACSEKGYNFLLLENTLMLSTLFIFPNHVYFNLEYFLHWLSKAVMKYCCFYT